VERDKRFVRETKGLSERQCKSVDCRCAGGNRARDGRKHLRCNGQRCNSACIVLLEWNSTSSCIVYVAWLSTIESDQQTPWSKNRPAPSIGAKAQVRS
jgi:hypothetical protein